MQGFWSKPACTTIPSIPLHCIVFCCIDLHYINTKNDVNTFLFKSWFQMSSCLLWFCWIHGTWIMSFLSQVAAFEIQQAWRLFEQRLRSRLGTVASSVFPFRHRPTAILSSHLLDKWLDKDWELENARTSDRCARLDWVAGNDTPKYEWTSMV